MRHCPFCGKEVKENDKFCFTCGKSLQPSEVVQEYQEHEDIIESNEKYKCNNCGSELNINDKFCGNCGAEIAGPEDEKQIATGDEIRIDSEQPLNELHDDIDPVSSSYRKVEPSVKSGWSYTFVLVVYLVVSLGLGIIIGLAIWGNDGNTVDKLTDKVIQLNNDILQLNTEVTRLNGVIDNQQAENDKLKVDLLAVETSNPTEVTYFSSSSQLEDWLSDMKFLETTEISSIEEDYANALKLQEEALKDGFIINAYINSDDLGEYMWVWCDARTLSGDVYYWGMLDFLDYNWYGNWSTW